MGNAVGILYKEAHYGALRQLQPAIQERDKLKNAIKKKKKKKRPLVGLRLFNLIFMLALKFGLKLIS